MGRPPLKKEAIERAALELFVERGVDGTSVRDIAARAGVTEGALYRHHAGKDELVRALFFDHFAQFAEINAAAQVPGRSFAQVIGTLVESFFAIHDKDHYVFEFILVVRHKLLDEVRSDDKNPIELVSRLLKDAIKRGEIPVQNTDVTRELLIGMVLQTTIGERYGRLKGPLTVHSGLVTAACLAVSGAKV